MHAVKKPITSTGYAKLKERLKNLINVMLPDVAKAIASAKELGDLSENADYHAAMSQKSQLDAEVDELSQNLLNVYVISMDDVKKDSVRFGATVTLRKDDDSKVTYTIVGEDEANLDNGWIAIASPLAKALLGQKKDVTVELNMPKGTKCEYIIESIQYDIL